ncbi:MAG TPA: transglutaminase domain-containing protein [Bacteroidales bacterium]|nr:transglutaminase domain-containing protein [Bacteroidales bacterium]HPS50311.1 transglutaminase domain-containing protein [Bacteroidales bacterium]
MTLKTSIVFALCIALTGPSLFAQQALKVIKANSKTVDIKDGNTFKKATWTIVPSARPDIYKTSAKRVTFYTDLDSISFKVKPGHEYNFVILLNGKDSAFTQIKYEKTEQVSYLDILKKASKYDFNDSRELAKFTYKPVSDTGLIHIRKDFKLDSVIGGGNEVSQILSLLHWVHNTFPHDGTKDAPNCSSIHNLMDICISGHHTVDCGSLANILNNCYLAAGFKSRRVVCLPKDSTDFDCHSINTVYSNSLNKWVWVDPTNDAYVINEKGELLSIAEVRQRLIENKPLILNPEANWNHRSSVTKEEYLYYYMAKNLYALMCFVSSGGEIKCNLLLPVEYKGVIPRTRANNPKCTNNPDKFWVKPD